MMALVNESSVRKFEGLKSFHTFSTICRPLSDAMRKWAMSFAGIDEAPGNVSPNVSAMAVIVDAVPIVMQCPLDLAIPSSISHHSASVRLPARRSAQYFHASEPEPRVVPRQLPFCMGPPGTKMNGRRDEIPPMIRPGVVLSQAPRRIAPSAGWDRSTSSVSIASKFR